MQPELFLHQVPDRSSGFVPTLAILARKVLLPHLQSGSWLDDPPEVTRYQSVEVHVRALSGRAGAVLMSVSSLTEVLDPAGIGCAAGLIAASRLRVGQFDALAAVLKRASAAGVASAELLAAMETVLGNRGTLRSLEGRLFP